MTISTTKIEFDDTKHHLALQCESTVSPSVA